MCPPVVARMVVRAAAQTLVVVAQSQVHLHKNTTPDYESAYHVASTVDHQQHAPCTIQVG